jgi:hypothetical protein
MVVGSSALLGSFFISAELSVGSQIEEILNSASSSIRPSIYILSGVGEKNLLPPNLDWLIPITPPESLLFASPSVPLWRPEVARVRLIRFSWFSVRLLSA